MNRLRPVDLEIPAEDPYVNDKFARKSSVEFLQQIVSQKENSISICLNGRWGSGKTTFLRMLKSVLESNGHIVLLFNAWEHDYEDDELLSLLDALSVAVNESRYAQAEHGNLAKAADGIKRYGSALIKAAIPVATKLATLGALDLTDAAESIAAEASGKGIDDVIKHLDNRRTALKKFKSSLAQFAEQCSSIAGDQNANLIIIVDELDRCRPDYALRMLDKIKHLLSVPKIGFIVAVDKQQLVGAARVVYGADLDGSAYLRRFFDIEFNLPVGPTRHFVRSLFDRFQIPRNNYDAQTIHGIEKTAAFLFDSMGISLRDQERCLTQIVLAIDSPHARAAVAVLCALTVAKLAIPDAFQDYLAAKANVSSFMDSLRGRIQNTFAQSDRALNLVEAGLYAAELGGTEDFRAWIRRDADSTLATYRQVASKRSPGPLPPQHITLQFFEQQIHHGNITRILELVDLVSHVEL